MCLVSSWVIRWFDLRVVVGLCGRCGSCSHWCVWCCRRRDWRCVVDAVHVVIGVIGEVLGVFIGVCVWCCRRCDLCVVIGVWSRLFLCSRWRC